MWDRAAVAFTVVALGACAASGSGSEPEVQSRRVDVVRVIDGDTVELGDGRRVRLIGIDTPEQGACGYREAAERVEELTIGREVRLSGEEAGEDRYGRSLRYLETPEGDLGTLLLGEGFARTRYDSRDGYGRHRLEEMYINTEESATAICP